MQHLQIKIIGNAANISNNYSLKELFFFSKTIFLGIVKLPLMKNFLFYFIRAIIEF